MGTFNEACYMAQNECVKVSLMGSSPLTEKSVSLITGCSSGFGRLRGRHKISVSNVSDIGTYCIVPFSVERVGMNIDPCDLLF